MVNDFGPIYAETVTGRFPVEPYNTASNLIFLFILIYFGVRTGLSFKRHPLIVGGLPILLIGFIGGTLFHATRANRVWLLMDFIPIFTLAGLVSVFFWRELLKNLILAFGAMAVPILTVRWIRRTFELPMAIGISIGYTTLALAALAPILIVSIRERDGNLPLVVKSMVLFGIALFFRYIDRTVDPVSFPMGTHFLWHLFGGVSVFYLMEYLRLRDIIRLERASLK